MADESYESIRRKDVAKARRLVPQFVRRLGWNAERIAQEQQQRLRELIAVARDRSPWHAQRLAGVDPERVMVDDLASLPTMSKDDLMDNWDRVVTDDRLTTSVVDQHLESLETDDYLLGSYHACVTGGSSGRRGVFIYDADAWTTIYAASVRNTLREVLNDPALAAAPKVMAAVASNHAAHITAASHLTFGGGMMETHRFPITTPLDELVVDLNQLRPTFLFGYATVLCKLAHEARAGRLDIEPRRISPTAEPLAPEMRALLEETFGVPVINHWASTEGGMMAVGSSRSPHMILSEDLLIFDFVDDDGRRVAPGETCAKVLLTNLFNHAMPLINYELTDEVTVLDEPCPFGSGYRMVADIQGRSDEHFRYVGGQVVHPFMFRSPLGRDRNVVEFQIRQTEAGGDVLVRCVGDVDTGRLAVEIAEHLAAAGLPEPVVTVRVVDEIPSTGGGKLKRFIGLPRS